MKLNFTFLMLVLCFLLALGYTAHKTTYSVIPAAPKQEAGTPLKVATSIKDKTPGIDRLTES